MGMSHVGGGTLLSRGQVRTTFGTGEQSSSSLFLLFNSLDLYNAVRDIPLSLRSMITIGRTRQRQPCLIIITKQSLLQLLIHPP